MASTLLCDLHVRSLLRRQSQIDAVYAAHPQLTHHLQDALN